MNAATIVTIIAAFATILVIGGFLVAAAYILFTIERQLHAIIGSVATITERTQPVAGVVDAINGDLERASGSLTSLLSRKAGGASEAATLVASVDPLRGTDFADADEWLRDRGARSSGDTLAFEDELQRRRRMRS
jgi:hypothetical protein